MNGSGGRIQLSDCTPEQRVATDLFMTEQSLKINAFAGSGKTTTLRVMGESTKRRGLYLAFNRSVADYASRLFPSNVECRTIHSLAFRQMHQTIRLESKLIGTINRNQVCNLLNLSDYSVGSHLLFSNQLASLIQATLKVFLHSQDDDVQTAHMPTWGILNRFTPAELQSIAKHVCKLSRKLWQMMQDVGSPTPLGHDGYLKLWALGRPKLDVDFILLDEAQDSNPVMLEVLRQQESQVIYVGDRHQQIYQWRGAINAMEQVKTKHETYLTQSFRFGKAIAELANRVLGTLGEQKLLVGNSEVKSQLSQGTANAIITRTNAMLVSMVVRELEKGGQPYVEGGTQELLRLLEGVRALKAGRRSDQPEFFGFKNWNEFQVFAKSDEGAEWRMLVGLVEEYTVDTLIHTLSCVTENPRESSVVLSTTHKAKGREWDSVELTDDFKVATGKEGIGPSDYEREELRIAYVALTRAKQSLNVPESLLNELMKNGSDDKNATKENDIPKKEKRSSGANQKPKRAKKVREQD
jgi:superfamily I DNA/RNA helicase